MLSADIFGDVEPNQIRYKKPSFSKAVSKKKPTPQSTVPKHLKKINSSTSKTNLFDSKLAVGNIVNHQRFGQGEVLSIDGKGADLKAEINFKSVGTKKLLLRFAKLEILS